MTMTHNNDKGSRKEGQKMTKEGKEDYQVKEGSQSREGRKMTIGGVKDYQLKEGSQLREGRKST